MLIHPDASGGIAVPLEPLAVGQPSSWKCRGKQTTNHGAPLFPSPRRVSRSSASVGRCKGDTFSVPPAPRQQGSPRKYCPRTRCETTRAPGFPGPRLITKPGACDCIQPFALPSPSTTTLSQLFPFLFQFHHLTSRCACQNRRVHRPRPYALFLLFSCRYRRLAVAYRHTWGLSQPQLKKIINQSFGSSQPSGLVPYLHSSLSTP